MLNIKKSNNENIVLNAKDAKRFVNKFEKDKGDTYLSAIQVSSKKVNNEIGNDAITVFKPRNKSFSKLFSNHIYNNNKDKAPGILFFVKKLNYFHLFEFGGSIEGKGKGLLVPLHKQGYGPYKQKNGRNKFKEMVNNFKSMKKIFWKKINGNVMMFVKYDKDTKKTIDSYRKKIQFRDKSKAVTKEEKRIKRKNNRLDKITNQMFPLAILKKSVYIKKRFDYSRKVIDKFPRETIKYFNDKFSSLMKK